MAIASGQPREWPVALEIHFLDPSACRRPQDRQKIQYVRLPRNGELQSRRLQELTIIAMIRPKHAHDEERPPPVRSRLVV